MTPSASTRRTELRTSTLDRQTLMQLAVIEYQRVDDQLTSLEPDDWHALTECPGWDVRAMACHLLGMVEMAASIREALRQQKAAGLAGGELVDAVTALQVDERRRMEPAELVARFTRMSPRAARSRRRTPGFIRRRSTPEQTVGDQRELWTMGYLLDTILTRDPWMHRGDISRATGHDLHLTADHDGVIVADVVSEWMSRHGQAFDLMLTGPAGGRWTAGSGGAEIEMDAVEFCRALSGRTPADGLLQVQVPF